MGKQYCITVGTI